MEPHELTAPVAGDPVASRPVPRRHVRRLRAAAAIALTLATAATAACSDDDGTTDASSVSPDNSDGDSDGEVAITDAWARPTPEGSDIGAAYLTLEAPQDDSVVGISIDEAVASRVEIHETVVIDPTESTRGAHSTGNDSGGTGMVGMQPVDALDLPAGQPVRLQPGEMHLMLRDLAGPLDAGDEFELTIDFEHADDRTIAIGVSDTSPYE